MYRIVITILVGFDINIRISELEDSLGSRVEKLGSEKVDKSVLGALLISLGEKISKG